MKLEVTFSTARELLPPFVPASPTLILRGPRTRGQFATGRTHRAARFAARRGVRGTEGFVSFDSSRVPRL
jgi:hypothetical protein